MRSPRRVCSKGSSHTAHSLPMKVLSRRVRERSSSSMPAIGRPDRQLKDVWVPLLYTGFGWRSACCTATRFNKKLPLAFGLYGFPPSTRPSGAGGGYGRPEAEWVDNVDI